MWRRPQSRHNLAARNKRRGARNVEKKSKTRIKGKTENKIARFCLKNVENEVKNPHKTNFCLQKRGKRGRFESRKSLIYKRKTLFSTFPRFSKTFSSKNIQKDILALICGN